LQIKHAKKKQKTKKRGAASHHIHSPQEAAANLQRILLPQPGTHTVLSISKKNMQKQKDATIYFNQVTHVIAMVLA